MPIAGAASVMGDGEVPILNGYLNINCYQIYTIEYCTYFVCDGEVSINTLSMSYHILKFVANCVTKCIRGSIQ